MINIMSSTSKLVFPVSHHLFPSPWLGHPCHHRPVVVATLAMIVVEEEEDTVDQHPGTIIAGVTGATGPMIQTMDHAEGIRHRIAMIGVAVVLEELDRLLRPVEV